ncbi:MAG: hypothetical protein AAFR36_32260 [Bacteroidota bacterium]
MTLSRTNVGDHAMRACFNLFFLAVCLLGGNAVSATPKTDAAYIVRRNLEPEVMETFERQLKNAFVSVYFKPLSKLGIDIIDWKRFSDLIPDDDVAPYIDRILSQTTTKYLSIYTPEQLTSLANLLRSDPNLSTSDIFDANFRQRYLNALEDARKQVTPSGSDDQRVIGLEETIVQLKAFTDTFDGEGAEEFAQAMASSVAPVILLLGASREIALLEREIENPVILSVLREEGILRFANPVQQQTLLRQLTNPKDESGIRFQKPPKK